METLPAGLDRAHSRYQFDVRLGRELGQAVQEFFMLSILGSRKRLCDGLSRRDMLQAGASSLLGLRLADLIAKPTTASPIGRPRHFGKAKNVILLYLYGAVSQIDTLDPKPDA